MGHTCSKQETAEDQSNQDDLRTVKIPGYKECPSVGLGTFTNFGKCGTADDVTAAVKFAIDCGYRCIDCAYVYGNEEAVGKAIQEKIGDGTVKREDIFITSKLWNTHHNPSDIESALKKSLTSLKTDYVDLYLMHYPLAFKDGDDLVPMTESGIVAYADHDYVDTWKAMENLVDAGLAKTIGLSNFNHNQIKRLLDSARIPPANLQIEVHAYMLNEKIVDFCKTKKITVTGYAPFGNPSMAKQGSGAGDVFMKNDSAASIFDEQVLKEIAVAKKKTVAQILLRFHVQRGIMVVPKSVTQSRIKENINIYDFELTKNEMSKIADLNKNERYYALAPDHKYYPYNDEY